MGEKVLKDKYYHRDTKINALQRLFEADLANDARKKREIIEAFFPELHSTEAEALASASSRANFVDSEFAKDLTPSGVLMNNYSHGLIMEENLLFQEARGEFENEREKILESIEYNRPRTFLKE